MLSTRRKLALVTVLASASILAPATTASAVELPAAAANGQAALHNPNATGTVSALGVMWK